MSSNSSRKRKNNKFPKRSRGSSPENAISNPTVSGGKSAPPFVRLLNSEGKLTHIALAERTGYRVYRVLEDGYTSLDISSQTSSEPTKVTSSNTLQSDEIAKPMNAFHVTASNSHSELLLVEEFSSTSHINFSDCNVDYYVEDSGINETWVQGYDPETPYIDEKSPGRHLSKSHNDQAFHNQWNYSEQLDAVELKKKLEIIINMVKAKNLSTKQAIKQFLDLIEIKTSIGNDRSCQNFMTNKEAYECSRPSTDRADINRYRDDIPSKESCASLNSMLPDNEINAEPVTYIRLLNRRGKQNNIAIADGDGYRIYRLSKVNGTREYFRCSYCDALRKRLEDPVAVIGLINGVVRGNANPKHHPMCPIHSTSMVIANELDRQARWEKVTGRLTPRQTKDKSRIRSLEEGKADSMILSKDSLDCQMVKMIYHNRYGKQENVSEKIVYATFQRTPTSLVMHVPSEPLRKRKHRQQSSSYSVQDLSQEQYTWQRLDVEK